jgi:hypothetical protein
MAEPFCSNPQCGTLIREEDQKSGVCSQCGTQLPTEKIASPTARAYSRSSGLDAARVRYFLWASLPWNWDWAIFRSGQAFGAKCAALKEVLLTSRPLQVYLSILAVVIVLAVPAYVMKNRRQKECTELLADGRTVTGTITDVRETSDDFRLVRGGRVVSHGSVRALVADYSYTVDGNKYGSSFTIGVQVVGNFRAGDTIKICCSASDPKLCLPDAEVQQIAGEVRDRRLLATVAVFIFLAPFLFFLAAFLLSPPQAKV